MPKEKTSKKKGSSLRHAPLGTDAESKKVKPKVPRTAPHQEDEHSDSEQDEQLPKDISSQIFHQAREQRQEMSTVGQVGGKKDLDEDSDYDDDLDEEENDEEELVDYDGEYVSGSNLSAAEESLVHRFLDSSKQENRTLADIIMNKIREKEEENDDMGDNAQQIPDQIPPKVVEVYTMVGKMLHTYRAGKLPKALKMLPHLRNWEDVLWLTRPDEWSASATYACTRIFASNLNDKMAQRFYNMVLLEKCRDDIRSNNKLNYHLYMALKKALFKPGAFYKGILLPLAMSKTCTLREATIMGSVLSKVSIPPNHSAAALLRLATMQYSGSTSMFIRILINKKYALPRRVVDELVNHFVSFESETKELPVLWHQSLLAFAQRYKYVLDDDQKNRLKSLLKIQNHHQITPEVRRELFNPQNPHFANSMAS